MKLDYELLDFGNGFRLERFGNNIVMRPDSSADGEPRVAIADWKYAASCLRRDLRGVDWEMSADFQEPWIVSMGSIQFELHASDSKNIGVFPEQEQNWTWLTKTIAREKRELKVLNLFAYTGGASLVCAKSGAQVCHVDSARSTVRWASNNAKLSGLEQAGIRWIVDDAVGFITKEIRRGNVYDGIILDPPPMGHSKNNRFEFRKDALDLITSCKKLLSPNPAFFLLNAYAMNLSARQIGQLVGPVIGLPLEVGELQLKEARGDRGLSCSVFARFRPNN